MRVENYSLNPRKAWAYGALIALFIFSFLAQFIYNDIISLSWWTTIYIVFIIYISLRTSKLFDSPPFSWDAALRMIGKNLEVIESAKVPLINKLNKNYSFLYMTRISNVYEGFKLIVSQIKHTFRLAPKPTPTPEALDGLTQIGMTTTGTVATLGVTFLIQDFHTRKMRELQGEKLKLKGEELKLKEEELKLKEEELKQKAFKDQEELKLKAREIQENSIEKQINYYDMRIKEGGDPGTIQQLIADRDHLIKFRKNLANLSVPESSAVPRLSVSESLPPTNNDSLIPSPCESIFFFCFRHWAS